MSNVYASLFAARQPFYSPLFSQQGGQAIPANQMIPALLGQGTDQFGAGSSPFSAEMFGAYQMMAMMMMQQQFGLMLLAHLLTSGAGQQQQGGRNAGALGNPSWGNRRGVPSWDPSRGSTQGPSTSSMPQSTGTYAPGRTYPPGSPEARQLFREAASRAGLPPEWGDSPGLHNILRRESGGQVGRPNYTYGSRARDPSQWGSIHNELRNGRKTTRSSATGLGQLLLANVDRYYPSGRAGIGDPMEEAVGMLKYIQDRYGTPEAAWAAYGTRHEGY